MVAAEAVLLAMRRYGDVVPRIPLPHGAAEAMEAEEMLLSVVQYSVLRVYLLDEAEEVSAVLIS